MDGPGTPRRQRSLAIICVLWWILWATTFSVPRLLGWRGGDSLFDGFSWWLHLTFCRQIISLSETSHLFFRPVIYFNAPPSFEPKQSHLLFLLLSSKSFPLMFVSNACSVPRFRFWAKPVQSLATAPAKWVIRTPPYSTSCAPTPPLKPLNPGSVPAPRGNWYF